MATNKIKSKANEAKNEIKRITESGNYDVVKYTTSTDAPVDCFMAICRRGHKDYLVDHTEDSIKEVFEADELRPNLGSVTPATFRVGDKWGMVNSRGEIILEAKYDSVKPDANEFIFLTLGGKEGFIAGGNIIDPKFDSIEIDADDYLEVSLNGENGYVDENDGFTADRSEAYYNMNMFL